MRSVFWIFVLVLALAVSIAWLSAIDEPSGLRGQPHAEVPGVFQGGDGEARHGPLLLTGWLFGCGVILTFSALIRFGALRRAGRERLATALTIVTFLYLGAWSWLIWAYRASFGADSPTLILTLPQPTAIMIFVFWPISMLFSALFVVGFDRWVLTAEEEAAFDRLVAANRADESD